MIRTVFCLCLLLAAVSVLGCGGIAAQKAAKKEDAKTEEKPKFTAVTQGQGTATEARDPEELLREVADFYRGIKSFEVEVSQTWQSESQGGAGPKGSKSTLTTDAHNQFSFRIQRPNQFCVLGEDCISYVSNGTRRYIYSPALSRYSEFEAPETMTEAVTDSEYRLAAGENRPFLLHFLEDDAYDRMHGEIIGLKHVGITKVELSRTGDKVERVPAHRLVMLYAGTEVEMTIAAEKEPVVYRIVTRSIQSNIPPQAAKAASKKTSAAAARLTTKRIRTEIYQDWRLNANLPVFAAFPIAPPAEATKVSSLAWELRPPGEVDSAWIGRLAPPLELPLLDGGTFKLADHRNKEVVVLNFWTSIRRDSEWEVPTVAGTAAGYSGDQVVHYAVNERESSETIQGFMSKYAVDAHVALDEYAQAAKLFRIYNLPTVVLIDMQGRVRSVHYDLSSSFIDRLNAELRALVQESRLDTELLERISPEMPASELVEALAMTDTRIRDKAVDALAAKGSESIPPLVTALSSRDVGVRLWAAAALEALGNKSLPAADLLVKLLDDRDPGVRLAAARALGKIGSEVVPRLSGIIASSKATSSARVGAATALGNVAGAGEEAVKPLIEALHDRDPRVRMAATNGLSAMGAPAVPVLATALEDDRETAFTAAGVALSRMGEVALPALIKALDHPKVTVRYTACLALGKMGAGASSAVGALKKASNDPDSNVRFYAEKALRDIE